MKKLLLTCLILTEMKKSIILFFFFFTATLFAQEKKAHDIMENNQQFTKAKDLYQEGNYDSCLVLLEDLLKGRNYSKKERNDMFELLINAYLEKDDLPKAETTVERLFQNDPHYELIEADNTVEFNRLIRKYDVYPKFSLGVRNTVIHSTYTIGKVYSTSNSLINYNAPYNTSSVYYVMYYGWMEYMFKKDWSLNMEGIRYGLSYYRTLADNSSSAILTYNENMTVYKIPFYLRKYFHPTKNLLLYGAAGFSFDRIAAAQASAYYYQYTGSGQYVNKNSGNVNVLNSRNPFLVETMLAAGIGYNLKSISFYLDIRYYYGLTSFTNASARLDNPLLLNDYSYVDDLVRINQFEFGASISYHFSYHVKNRAKAL